MYLHIADILGTPAAMQIVDASGKFFLLSKLKTIDLVFILFYFILFYFLLSFVEE